MYMGDIVGGWISPSRRPPPHAMKRESGGRRPAGGEEGGRGMSCSASGWDAEPPAHAGGRRPLLAARREGGRQKLYASEREAVVSRWRIGDVRVCGVLRDGRRNFVIISAVCINRCRGWGFPL